MSFPTLLKAEELKHIREQDESFHHPDLLSLWEVIPRSEQHKHTAASGK